MDEEKPTEATEEPKEEEKPEEGKMEEENKEPEEEPTCMLKNPSRVLRMQEKTIEYVPENRYNAILEVSRSLKAEPKKRLRVLDRYQARRGRRVC
jgi:hypothetical protein